MGQRPSDLTPWAGPAHFWGAELRALREAQGMSLAALGRAVHRDASYVARVERAERPVPADLAADCDRVLGTGGTLVRLRALIGPDERRLTEPDRSAESSTPDAIGADPADETRLMAAVRRPSRLDERTIIHLAAALDAERRLEDSIGAAPLISTVVARLDQISRLVTGARGPLRRELVDVAGQWAQFAGWLHTSIGDRPNATAWWDRASEWAAEAGDQNLTGTILSFRGNLAWRCGEIGAALGLTDAALRVGRDSAGMACEYYLLARGQATLGDADAARQSLDQAVRYAAEARPDNTAPWGYYYLAPGFFTLTHGLVIQCLARHDPEYHTEAIDLLTSGLDELPPEMRRSDWAGVYVLRLAAACARAGDLTNAERRASEAARIAADTASPSLASQSESFLRRLTEPARPSPGGG